MVEGASTKLLMPTTSSSLQDASVALDGRLRRGFPSVSFLHECLELGRSRRSECSLYGRLDRFHVNRVAVVHEVAEVFAGGATVRCYDAASGQRCFQAGEA